MDDSTDSSDGPQTGSPRLRWRRLILFILKSEPAYYLTSYFVSLLQRSLSRAEYSALHRAAKALERQGVIEVVYTYSYPDWKIVTVVGRPGATVCGEPLKNLNVERVPRGTRSTFEGSIRDVAAKFAGTAYETGRSTIGRRAKSLREKARQQQEG